MSLRFQESRREAKKSAVGHMDVSCKHTCELVYEKNCSFDCFIDVLKRVKQRTFKALMAQTRLGGWTIGQPSLFGRLSKQHRASPAALCKHPSSDPERRTKALSTQHKRERRYFTTLATIKSCGNMREGLNVAQRHGAEWDGVYDMFPLAMESRLC